MLRLEMTAVIHHFMWQLSVVKCMEVALSLINEFHCDTHATGNLGRSLLHEACEGGSVRLL